MSMCKYGCGRTAEKGRSRCRSCRRQDKARNASVRPGGPRVLLIDIETSPLVVYTWGLWQQNIGINQIIEPTRMLCFAAKWLGSEQTMFFSEHGPKGRLGMVAAAHELLDQADVVIHFYGSRFDIPHLNREFLEHDMSPPSPYKQVDLKLAVSKRFKLPSNKLEFVSRVLGLDGKVKHSGFDLWPAFMRGDADALAQMEKYNRRDVTLLEEVYARLLPWIPNQPHRHLYEGDGCPACGGRRVGEDGLYRTALSTFIRYRCEDCGSWFRSSKRLYGTALQQAVL